jgi:hypothetical protein
MTPAVRATRAEATVPEVATAVAAEAIRYDPEK